VLHFTVCAARGVELQRGTHVRHLSIARPDLLALPAAHPAKGYYTL